MNNVTEITKKMVLNILPIRMQDSHKGSFGSVLNIAGSKNYMGAAYLSSVAPLRVGAGYVTLASVEDVINSVASKASEIVFLKLNSYNSHISSSSLKQLDQIISTHNVISVGCGLGAFDCDKKELYSFLGGLINILNNLDKTVVFDADAINIMSLFEKITLPKKSVLTPHPKELGRLLNKSVDEIQSDRLQYAIFAAQKYSATVILKGHNTVITDGVNSFINKNANSALAKAGTGDVLTGIISGFLAQGVSPLNAAIIGVYLHGMAGKRAANELTQYGVLASNLLNYLPLAIKDLFTNEGII